MGQRTRTQSPEGAGGGRGGKDREGTCKGRWEQHREAQDTKKQGVPVKPQEAGEQNMTISEKLMRFNDRLAAKDRAANDIFL